MLLGGNNRLIGAATAGEPTMSRAVLAAEHARSIADTADFGYFVADDRHWYWRLLDESGPIAVSASGFARRLDAQRAARRFRHAASTADIQLGLVTIPERVRLRPNPSREQDDRLIGTRRAGP
jgi:hypothetical protein